MTENLKIKDYITLAIKGFIVGSTMTVPGVSGGSMAIAIGVYENLVRSVDNLFKRPFKSLLYLTSFGIPALLGIVLLAGIISNLLKSQPLLLGFLFLGVIAGGIPIICKEAGLKRLRPDIVVCQLIGLLCVLGISNLPEDLVKISTSLTPIMIILQLFAGFLLAIALVLPGISLSQMLLMLGLYSPIVDAVKGRHFIELIPIALGTVISLFIIAKLFVKLLNNFKLQSYMVILGFLIGSLIQLYPGKPSSSMIFPCFALMIFGFVVMYLLSMKLKVGNE